MYLAGYGIYRLNNEPPQYIWLGFYYRDLELKEYLAPFERIWVSGEPVGMKLFHTLYTPCYVAENWMIDKVLK
jgi:hypothetical protein